MFELEIGLQMKQYVCIFIAKETENESFILTVELGITEQSTLNTVFFTVWTFWDTVLKTYHPAAVLTSILHEICHPPPSHLTELPFYMSSWFLMCLPQRREPREIHTAKYEAWDGAKKKRQCFLYLTFFLSCPSIASSFPLLSVKMGKINCFQSSWLNGVHRARTEFWQMTQI